MSTPSSQTIKASAYFSLRIVNIDYYMAPPGPMDRSFCPFNPQGAPLHEVPVVRIFGATEEGQRACLHVHQAFPYFYIPYTGSLDHLTVHAHIHQLGTSLNHAIALSLHRNPLDSRRSQFVASIVLVKGVPFYGYHVGYRYFLKVHLVNPTYRARIADILGQGGVMGTRLQPHESHVPFELQFMMDYNLYGMGYIRIGRRGEEPDEGVRFRIPMPERVRVRVGGTVEEGGDYIAPLVYTIETVPARLVWSANKVGRAAERQTRCELEVDTTVMAILNREQVKERDLHSNFEEAIGIWKGKGGGEDSDEGQDEAKLVKSLALLWEDESRRRYLQNLPTTIPPVTQHEDRAPHLPWSDEPRLREMVRRLAEADATAAREVGDQGRDDTMHRLMERDDYDEDAMTAYQAVEALYPRRGGDCGEEGSEDRREKERDADELAEETNNTTDGPASSSRPPSSPPHNPTVVSTPKFTRSMSDLARLCPLEDSPATCYQLSQESAVIVDQEAIRLSQESREDGNADADEDEDEDEDTESKGESDREMEEIMAYMTRDGDGEMTAGDGEDDSDIQVEDTLGDIPDYFSDYIPTQSSGRHITPTLSRSSSFAQRGGGLEFPDASSDPAVELSPSSDGEGAGRKRVRTGDESGEEVMVPTTSMAARLRIPQFDGAADGVGEESRSGEVKEIRWKKTRRLSLGMRRRGREDMEGGDGNKHQQDDDESGSSTALSGNGTLLVETDADRKFSVRRVSSAPPVSRSSVVPAPRASQPASMPPKTSAPQKKRSCEVVVTPPKKRIHTEAGGGVAGEDDMEALENSIEPDDEEVPSDTHPLSFRLRKPEPSFDMSSSPPVPGSVLRSGRQNTPSPALRIDKRPIRMTTRVEAVRPRGPVTRSRSRLSEEGTRGDEEADLEKQGGKTLDWLKRKEGGRGVSVEEVFDDEREEDKEVVRWVLESVDVPTMDRRMMGGDKGWSGKEVLRHVLDENIGDVHSDEDRDDEIWPRVSWPEEKEIVVGDETVVGEDSYLRVDQNGREKGQTSELNVSSTRNSLSTNHFPSIEYSLETPSIIGDDDRIQLHLKNIQVERDAKDANPLYQSSPYDSQPILSPEWDRTFDDLPLPTTRVEGDESSVVSEKIAEVEIQSDWVIKRVSSVVNDNGGEAALEKDNTKLSLSASNEMAMSLTSAVIEPSGLVRQDHVPDTQSGHSLATASSSAMHFINATQSALVSVPSSLGDPLVATPPCPPVAAHWPIAPATRAYVFAHPPPTTQELEQSLTADFGLPRVVYREPYFGSDADVPMRPTVYAGKEFRLKSESVRFLAEFNTQMGTSTEKGDGDGKGKGKERMPGERKEVVGLEAWKRVGGGEERCNIRAWTIARMPPGLEEVEQWLEKERRRVGGGEGLRMEEQSREVDEEGWFIIALDYPFAYQVCFVSGVGCCGLNSVIGDKTIMTTPLTPAVSINMEDVSQIEGNTPKNKFGFKFSQNKSAAIVHDKQNIDIFSVEVHVNTRGQLLPNPSEDPVSVIFWCLQTEEDEMQSNGYRPGYRVGLILTHGVLNVSKTGLAGYDVDYVDDERSMFNALIEKVWQYDPDILTGYEIHNSSWGYLIERADTAYQINLCSELSRVIPATTPKFGREEDAWGFRQTSSINIDGRHLLNVWRLVRSEVDLNMYTFENVAFHILHQRIPHFSYATLSTWFARGPAILKWRVLKYYIDRVQRNLELLEVSEIVSRTSEFARLFGVDFFSVISRGSQFKVESMMLRIAKPENFIMISPNKKQVASQRAAECLPLVMEPESKFYNSPLVVLDFQSLYPSVMIAYNYCYSTCLGKIGPPDGTKKFGVASLDLPTGLLDMFGDYITVSPNGLMYVKPSVRKSLLAKMLSEILETRVMVKRSMNENKSNKALEKLLNARQLGLKYIANVTYGYTGASFSGRMPGVEIADSIVQTGRETLERAIDVINSTERWGARVVYGDTDSVFVTLPGRTKDEAFDIGADIAETITKMNPAPIRLKFEKVYHPCVLLAKKRYVGFKYESRDETVPEFDAKGIETVRRDGVPAVQKIMEQCLKILFRTQDLSELKSFLQRQWSKILAGRVSLQDFIFAKEVKLGSYSERGLPPPGALVSTRKMVIDPRSEPQYGERIPYVVVHGGPGARLADQVVPPEELLENRSLRLHGQYYITKQIIPSLERVFNLVGADIKSWFNEMPRVQRATAFTATQQQQPRLGGLTFRKNNGRTIDQYYTSQHCLVCREVTEQELCQTCQLNPSVSAFHLSTRQHRAEVKYAQLLDVCASCSQISVAQATVEPELSDSTSCHPCDSMDCPVYFERVKARNEVKMTMKYSGILDRLFEDKVRERSEPKAGGALVFAGQALDF